MPLRWEAKPSEGVRAAEELKKSHKHQLANPPKIRFFVPFVYFVVK